VRHKSTLVHRLYKLCRRLAEEDFWQLAASIAEHNITFLVRDGDIVIYQYPEEKLPFTAYRTLYPLDTTQSLFLEVCSTTPEDTSPRFDALVTFVRNTLQHIWAQDKVRQQLSSEMLSQYRESAVVLKAAQAFIGQVEKKEIAETLVKYFNAMDGVALLQPDGVVLAGLGVFQAGERLNIELPDKPRILNHPHEEEQWQASLCYPLHVNNSLSLLVVSQNPDFSFDTIYLQRVATLATIASTAFNNADLWRSRITLSRYLPRGVADKMLLDDVNSLGGVEQEATILFADIRGFTGLTRELGASETVRILNTYFTEIVRIVRANDGIIDKFMGDGVLAVFGVPYSSGHDADNALLSAKRILERVESLGIEINLPLKIGICMASGTVVSGNIGAPERMDYTVIGDAVNQAAKLQPVSKKHQAPIILLESTIAALRDEHLKDCVPLEGEVMDGLRVYKGI
jgi:class 3 adenylate cyclase